jgi:hypothetical protein
MQVSTLYLVLEETGFTVRCQGEQVMVSPRDRLTDELREQIRSCRDDLYALVEGLQRGSTSASRQLEWARQRREVFTDDGRPRCHQCGDPAPADALHYCLTCRSGGGDISREALMDAA